MNADVNKTLVQRYIEMWNTGNAAIADEILAPNWRDHNHPEVTGIEGVKQALLATRNAFPDFHISIEAVIAERNVVALRATIRQTQQGSLVTSPVAWFVRVDDGEMAELWTVA